MTRAGQIEVREVQLHLRVPFTISRATHTEKPIVLVEWVEGERVARGEASPDAFFGESASSLRHDIESALALLPDDPGAIGELRRRLDERFPHGGAASCALDILAHDRLTQALGVPLHRWLGLDPKAAPPTSFTIGIAEPQVMAERAAAAAAAGFEVLKVKLGSEDDVGIVRAVRSRYKGRLHVDANAAWDVERALRTMEALVLFGVEFVEQPLPPEDLDGLRALRARSALPIVVDESVVRAGDARRVAGIAHGINVKLMKCGGIAPARDLIGEAREVGLRVMVGCRAAESSVAIAAAAHLAPLADWADLDGNLLVADDPFVAVEVHRGRFVYPDRPGLGAVPRERP
jgi:L-alanine-DL-glutamate epimerase-like enolase superfamily enzyme